MSNFDTALHDVFQGREAGFSSPLMDLLRQLYERGGQDGVAGSRLNTLEEFRVGTRFSNSYLRRKGQRRVVTAVNLDSFGGVDTLTTDVVRVQDGVVLSADEVFDRAKLQTYAPYTRE